MAGGSAVPRHLGSRFVPPPSLKQEEGMFFPLDTTISVVAEIYMGPANSFRSS